MTTATILAQLLPIVTMVAGYFLRHLATLPATPASPAIAPTSPIAPVVPIVPPDVWLTNHPVILRLLTDVAKIAVATGTTLAPATSNASIAPVTLPAGVAPPAAK